MTASSRSNNELLQLPMVALIAVWMLMLFGGTLVVTAYSTAPGHEGHVVNLWPADTRLELAKHQPTMLIFVHSQCPCTRASIRELHRMLSSTRQSVQLHIVYYCPRGADSNEADIALMRLADRFAPKAVVTDHGAIETRRFGVTTSGHVMAFSPTGRCLFSGGVTARRGHEGANYGLAALEQAIAGTATDCSTFPVFGCPITARANGQGDAR